MKALIAALLVTAVMIVGCGPTVRLHIPRTPEALSCMRECMHMENECMRSACIGTWGWARAVCVEDCRNQDNDCCNTCPGAYWK